MNRGFDPLLVSIIHRLSLFFLTLGLLLGTSNPILPHRPTSATPLANGISIVETDANYTFAQEVKFTLHATADVDIVRVYLFLRATSDAPARPVPVEIEPTADLYVTHTLDLRRTPLQPFATATYWWHILDDNGNDLTTTAQSLEYIDDRFQWEALSDDTGTGITVHWIDGQGDIIFGQAALDVAVSSLKEINAELRAPLDHPIEIYIYDGQPNLRAAMVLTGREWVSGQAHPELGVILIAIPFEDGYTTRMKRDIPHEITHLLLYRSVTPEGYAYVPEWLDEGLATANERSPRAEFAATVEAARVQDQLLPLEDLCVPFSPDPTTALLSYAQSKSVVQYIQEEYGASGIRRLLTAYRDGASCSAGVREALDITLQRLETAWRASLEPQAPWMASLKQLDVWLGLWALSLLVAIPMIGQLRRKHVPQ